MRTVLIASLVLLSACNTELKEAQSRADQVKPTVVAEMKDPDSAKFRNLKVHISSLCGEVNAKNGFGAYTGYKKFSGVPGAVTSEWKLEEGFALLQSERGKQFWIDQQKSFDDDYKQCQKDGIPVT